MTRRTVPRRAVLGLSLVELMVGLAVGLFVSAVALAALSQQAVAHRRRVAEARLDQDLHTAAHLLALHLRRTGHWDQAAQGIWRAEAPPPLANPHGLDGPPDPAELRFSYSSPAAGGGSATHDRFGIRLRGHAVDLAIGDGRWQALTDPSRLRVTALQLAPVTQDRPVPAVCPRACGGSPPDCPPRARTVAFTLRLDATAAGDPSLRRQVETRVRLRNDHLVGTCSP